MYFREPLTTAVAYQWKGYKFVDLQLKLDVLYSIFRIGLKSVVQLSLVLIVGYFEMLLPD